MITKDAKTYSTPLGRLYGIDNNTYPSVTSILKGFKLPTGKANYTTDYMSLGTIGHHECLLPYAPDMEYPEVVFNTLTDEEINDKLDNINLMWNTIAPEKEKVVEVEFVVYSLENEYAGRGDILHVADDKLILGDIKTGQFYKYYELQLGGYFGALKDTIDIDSGQLYILDSNSTRNPEVKPQVVTYTREQLDGFAEKFIVKAKKYNKDMADFIEAW